MGRREQAAVLRELAFDEAGRQPHRSDLERGFTLAQSQRDLLGPTEQALELAQRPRGDEHALIAAQDTCAGQITDRQAVGVGGDEAESLVLGGHEDPGEDRSSVVRAGGRHDLVQRLSEVGAGQRDRVVGRAHRAGGTRRPAATGSLTGNVRS